ncbi:hypothetical protein OWV82_004672 [Melia azedarach]|uniref:Uncharacterized protein n=1 Tax=Melia azedarach TaxID=155640 RepID=A0ACC1YR04_MELAZ|nr:hypothetical protein OWV82_004672 [Melia azedarach]
MEKAAVLEWSPDGRTKENMTSCRPVKYQGNYNSRTLDWSSLDSSINMQLLQMIPFSFFPFLLLIDLFGSMISTAKVR